MIGGRSLLTMRIKEPVEPAEACVIWMHGLGSEAANMLGLVEQLPLTLPVRHVCLDAPVRRVTINNGMKMRAWYDIVGMHLTDREDREGIEQSETWIGEVIHSQLAEGFSASRLFLAGFSQGGAMALYAGLRSTHALGGIISLSAYLPLASTVRPSLHAHTPIFIGAGLHDPVVLPAWTAEGVEWLRFKGFDRVEAHSYPIEHTVCFEEITEIANWLTINSPSTLTDAGDRS